MKRSFVLSLSAVVAGLLAAGYFWTFQGPWLDSLFSRTLSQKLGWQIECENVRVTRWRRIDFKSATVKSEDQKTLVQTGAGRILLETPSLMTLRLAEVLMAEDIGSNVPFFSSLPQDLVQTPLRVREASVSVSKRGGGLNIHLTRFVSEGVILRGGAQVRAGRVAKAHVVMLFARDRSDKLPDDIRVRMMRRSDGWQGFRFVYGQNILTVMGAHGPLLRAQWKS